MSSMVLAAVLIPVCTGVLILISGRWSRWYRAGLAVAATGATTSIILALLFSGRRGGVVWWQGLGEGGASPLFWLDGTGLLLAGLFSVVWVLVAIYSLEYMRGYEFQDDYYGFFLVMFGAVIGLCLTQDLILLYLFWEIAAVGTWRLVVFYRGEREIRVAQKTLLMNFAGSVLMLTGFVMLFIEKGSFFIGDFNGIVLSPFVLILILAGIVTKSASLPFYVWLPDAHSVAPAPMSALLSAIVAKVGLVSYLKIFVQGEVVLPSWWQYLVAGLGVGGTLVAAGCALFDEEYKRVLAFSTVSQIGYILVGMGFASGLGLQAAVVYLAAHCLAKSGLFTAFGVVEKQTHRWKIAELSGLGKQMPFVATAVAVLMLSIIGLPPLLGFFGKFYVIVAAVQSSILIAIGALIGAVITVLYMLRIYQVFLGEPKNVQGVREPVLMTMVVMILAVLSLSLGLVFPFVSSIFKSQLTGTWL